MATLTKKYKDIKILTFFPAAVTFTLNYKNIILIPCFITNF